MRLSIVIPAYNEANYLDDLLAHIGKVDDVEVIVADDERSTDKAAEMAKKHSAVYLTCDGDVSNARNMGAMRATGEYLLFLDADQLLWGERPIEKLLRWMDENPVDVATGPINQTTHTKRFHSDIREFYRTLVPTLSGGYILVKRKLFMDVGMFAPRSQSVLTWEDVDLDWKLRFRGFSIASLPFATTHRREFTWRLPDGTRIL